MYMCTLPVVRAEPLKFAQAGVREVVKNVFLPGCNAFRFLVGEATRYEASENAVFKQDSECIKKSTNMLDKQELTNWHIRLNRDRIKGDNGTEAIFIALCTLSDV
ncbi:unnamed protein product, partial [Prorocentrum cordatum]